LAGDCAGGNGEVVEVLDGNLQACVVAAAKGFKRVVAVARLLWLVIVRGKQAGAGVWVEWFGGGGGGLSGCVLFNLALSVRVDAAMTVPHLHRSGQNHNKWGLRTREAGEEEERWQQQELESNAITI